MSVSWQAHELEQLKRAIRELQGGTDVPKSSKSSPPAQPRRLPQPACQIGLAESNLTHCQTLTARPEHIAQNEKDGALPRRPKEASCGCAPPVQDSASARVQEVKISTARASKGEGLYAIDKRGDSAGTARPLTFEADVQAQLARIRGALAVAKDGPQDAQAVLPSEKDSRGVDDDPRRPQKRIRKFQGGYSDCGTVPEPPARDDTTKVCREHLCPCRALRARAQL